MSENLLSSLPAPQDSKSAALKKLLPAIEGALAQGHTHAAVHEYLKNTIGLDITFDYYQLTLHRLRKRRNQATNTQKGFVSASVHQPVSGRVKGGSAVGPPQPDESSGRKFSYDVHSPIGDFFS